jgi:hypothetical protein
MDLETFQYLYVNLNSLVELGLKRRAGHLLKSLADLSPLPELTPEEAEAQMMKSFENMDMSALDLVWENLRNTSIELESIEQAKNPHESAAEPLPELADGDDCLPDLDIYMQRAYAYKDVLRERIDALFAKADLVSMSQQVAQLSGTPTISSRLDGAQMAIWLERYDGDDTVLIELATEMRRLEMQG